MGTNSLIVIIFLITVAAIADATRDKLLFHYSRSIFKNLGNWWNPSESWRLKWKNGNKDEGERFLGSSTFLVWITDAWHFFQQVVYSCYSAAVLVALSTNYNFKILYWVIAFFVLKIIFGSVFTLFFKYIF